MVTSAAQAESTFGRIGVLMGGRSAEREISLQSGNAMLKALRERGHEVVAVDVAEDVCARIMAAQMDVALLALHGRWGEDGCIQGLLEVQGIPYTGSGVRASANALDKVSTKRLLQAAGLPTPAWAFPATVEGGLALGFPLVLKPRSEGSSVGLHIVKDEAQLRTLLGGEDTASEALLEAYIPGRELTVGVMGSGEAAQVLGTLEIRAAGGLYDYGAKYEKDDTEYLVPAPLSEPQVLLLTRLALDVHRFLDCAGVTRVDFRWDRPESGATEPLVLELNTLPGMTAQSLLPKIAAHGGLSYGELVEQVVADGRLKA
ncbi:MAG: D-alanine--D-alanine ligase [Deltaproteobacteria bacterium]|nr:D-alanine--D-alanine ligase [Deltaproteobacteria bacterium]